MKKFIFILVLLYVLFLYDNYLLKDTTYDIYKKYIKDNNAKVITNKKALETKYKTNNEYVYKEIDDDNINNKEELENKLYTIVNNGYKNYTFYCNYDNCNEDIVKLQDSNRISYINDFVNTYNKYENIKTNFYNNGKVELKVNKTYSDEDIKKIDDEINRIINETNINNYDDVKYKIELFHNYIINNSSYDQEYENNKDNDSNKATGILFDHKGVCTGYTDALSIFLDKINVENYKISTDNHIWNIVKINDEWFHIDATFDDPVTNSGDEILLYDYLLINTETLESYNDSEHLYNKDIFNFIN